MKILAMTVVKVLKREGISAAGEATMPEFLGISNEIDQGILQAAATSENK